MPAISYTDFSGGLDRRLPITVQEANRLFTLRNAFVTLGKRLRKRPGLVRIMGGLTGTYGLENVNGQLTVFATKGGPPLAVDPAVLVELDLPSGLTADSLRGIEYAEMFNGFPYVVAKYFAMSGSSETRVYRHHYVDANPNTNVTDANCPQTRSVTKAASRIFAIDGETVAYCAAGDPRDWTTASDAGFLPSGIQQNTKSASTAVGTYQDALVVFFEEGAQVWTVNVDPSANAFRKVIDGVGCKHPVTLANFANDLMFLSPFGFRSMTVQAQTDRIDDTDVGVPVDSLVLEDIPSNDEFDVAPVIGTWVHQLGQYWAMFGSGTGTKAWVYSFSKTGKLACWSEYTYPVRFTGITTVAGKVYLRTETSLYEVRADVFMDDSDPIEAEVQMAFQDAKTPGVEKQIWGGDFVMQGSWDVAFKYDSRDTGKETVSQNITGDSRPGQVTPVEVVAPAVAPVFRHSANELAEIDAITLFYYLLGV
jgi:hypothetical protein